MASAGVTVGVIVAVSPFLRVTDDLSRVIPVTGFVTVIEPPETECGTLLPFESTLSAPPEALIVSLQVPDEARILNLTLKIVPPLDLQELRLPEKLTDEPELKTLPVASFAPFEEDTNRSCEGS